MGCIQPGRRKYRKQRGLWKCLESTHVGYVLKQGKKYRVKKTHNVLLYYLCTGLLNRLSFRPVHMHPTGSDGLRAIDLHLPFVQLMRLHYTSPWITGRVFTHAFRQPQSKPVTFRRLRQPNRGHSGSIIPLCTSHHVYYTTTPLFRDSNLYAPPSCQHFPNTPTESVENTLSASSVLQMEGPVNQ